MPRRPPARGAAPGWTPRELVELAAQHGLAELEVETAGLRVRIVREHAPAAGQSASPAPPRETASLPAAAPAEAAPASTITVASPMVGTVYRAPSPGAPPFVSEGDVVKEGQVLCIIEAMKLMNEIEARVAGRVVKILVDNAQPVEYGQPLFLIEPAR